MSNFDENHIIHNRNYAPHEFALLAIAVAIEKKAVRPVVMDLRPQGGFTEFFAIVSAANARQVYAIAESIHQFFKKNLGILPLAKDGLESCTWVLIDYGFLFVHIFQESTRELYQLEQLWNKAHFLSVTEDEYLPLYEPLKKVYEENNCEEK